MADNKLITERQAAEVLDVHKATLASWRHEGRGPAYVKIGRNVRYRPSDVTNFIDARTVRPAS